MTEVSLKDSLVVNPNAPPIERAIKDMLARVRVITSPERIIPAELQSTLAPEFDIDAVREGKVVGVAQAYAASTSGDPIKTINVDKCNVVLVRYGDPHRYDLFHNQNGDMDQNARGSRWDDVKERYGTDAEAMLISSKKSLGVIPTIRQMGYKGIITRKRIEIEQGRQNISVVYRPRYNKVLIRLGELPEILEFEGF